MKKVIQPKKFSRVTGKPMTSQQKNLKAFEPGAKIPKGVTVMKTPPKPNSYMGV